MVLLMIANLANLIRTCSGRKQVGASAKPLESIKEAAAEFATAKGPTAVDPGKPGQN